MKNLIYKLFPKIVTNEKVYIWMLLHFPRKMMWVNGMEKNDMGSKFWTPRFGNPKSWIKESEEWAEKTNKELNWK